MQRLKTVLDTAILLRSPRFDDERGSFEVTFEAEAARDLGILHPFVQDNQSTSSRAGTIRGIHLQLSPHEQGKLVRVLRGRILDVVIDLRPDSATFGSHASVELDDRSGDQLWVPRGFGHAFCTLSPDTTVFYKVDAPYVPQAERTLRWDDDAAAVAWPDWVSEPILSWRDAEGLSLAEVAAAVQGAEQ